MHGDSLLDQIREELIEAKDAVLQAGNKVNENLTLINEESKLNTLFKWIEKHGIVVSIQAYEHVLRSYKPKLCWLMLSVLPRKQGEIWNQVLVDATSHYEALNIYLKQICSN